MPVPEVWDMALDLQSCMVEAVVSLTRETMPRWRQVLLGGGDASDDRAVAGLTCTGANPPGGPPAGGDMILLGVSTSATATGLSMVGSGGAGAGVLGPCRELLTRITAGIFKWFVDTIYTAEGKLYHNCFDPKAYAVNV
ncbi:hypothetical protein FGIG_02885 [Fasciola gigantica]|uniref:Uncharacterized protein n=1 Tax=Fasciola gigantica TaxID=46835 RepID=A0A504YL52_FASGI|nr:hypothetical protein FGIG_02885 [Fasciola gigantica]